MVLATYILKGVVPAFAGQHELYLLCHVVLNHSTLKTAWLIFVKNWFPCHTYIIKGVIYCIVSVSYSPIKGNDVSQQQAPIVVWKFTIEEEVLAIQEVWRNENIWFSSRNWEIAEMEEKKQTDKWPSSTRKENLWFSIKGTTENEQLLITLSHCSVWKWTNKSYSWKKIQTETRGRENAEIRTGLPGKSGIG